MCVYLKAYRSQKNWTKHLTGTQFPHVLPWAIGQSSPSEHDERVSLSFVRDINQHHKDMQANTISTIKCYANLLPVAYLVKADWMTLTCRLCRGFPFFFKTCRHLILHYALRTVGKFMIYWYLRPLVSSEITLNLSSNNGKDLRPLLKSPSPTHYLSRLALENTKLLSGEMFN